MWLKSDNTALAYFRFIVFMKSNQQSKPVKSCCLAVIKHHSDCDKIILLKQLCKNVRADNLPTELSI